MPLNGATLKGTLKTSIFAELQTQFPIPGGLTGAEQAALLESQEKLAQAIADGDGPTTVTHIQSNAQVVVTVASVSGVTPGGGVSGPGAGTGTIT